MAITTYAELQTALTDWADDRGDVSAIESEAVQFAETRLNRELRCREMLTSTDLTPSSGAVTLPADFLGIYAVIEKTTPRRVLQFMGKEAIETKFDTTVSGLACAYTVVGDTLSTAPRATNDIELTYYQKIPSLEANSTNWLLTDHPDLYLEACQLEVYRYLKMDADLSISAERVARMIDQINASEDYGFLGAAAKTNNAGLVF